MINNIDEEQTLFDVVGDYTYALDTLDQTRSLNVCTRNLA